MPKNPHAVALGRKGGKANKGIPKPKSAENGKLGGRPKKLAPEVRELVEAGEQMKEAMSCLPIDRRIPQ